MKIQAKLITSHTAIMVIPLLLITAIIYSITSSTMNDVGTQTRKAMHTNANDALNAISELKAKQLTDYFKQQELTLGVLAKTTNIRDTYNKLVAYHKKHNIQATDSYDVATDEYKSIWNIESPFYQAYIDKDKYAWYDIFMICKKHGHVMYSQCKESDIGSNVKYGNLKNEGLGQIYQKVATSGKTEFVDFAPYTPSSGVPAAFLGTPIEINGEFIGILAMQFPHLNIHILNYHWADLIIYKYFII